MKNGVKKKDFVLLLLLIALPLLTAEGMKWYQKKKEAHSEETAVVSVRAVEEHLSNCPETI